jgi:hypothetical protein
MSRYLDEFVRLSRSPEMLSLKLFPNAKEITESFGAYAAVREHLDLDFGDPSICVLAVGDGFVPRTAATFAMRSAWICFSVDPNMRDRGWSRKVERLHAYRDKILPLGGWYVPDEFAFSFSRCVLVCVHSHASLWQSILSARGLAGKVSIVSIPCCVKHDYQIAAEVVYKDEGIISPERKVFVWRDV